MSFNSCHLFINLSVVSTQSIAKLPLSTNSKLCAAHNFFSSVYCYGSCMIFTILVWYVEHDFHHLAVHAFHQFPVICCV